MDFLGFFVPEDMPAHGLPLGSLGKYPLAVLYAQKVVVLLVLHLHIIKGLNEKEIGKLLDDRQGIRQPIGIHIIPYIINFCFHNSRNQRFPPYIYHELNFTFLEAKSLPSSEYGLAALFAKSCVCSLYVAARLCLLGFGYRF